MELTGKELRKAEVEEEKEEEDAVLMHLEM
jgi:hypothetical protein